MFEALKSVNMDQFIDLLKHAGTALAVLTPVFKLFPGAGRDNVHHLEERHKCFKTFFDQGGAEQHPLLVESAFGAALGHTKLDAREIPLILRQPKPTAFINSYLRVRSYLAPNKDGSRFELQSLAARPFLRKIFITVGIVAYGLFFLTAIWMLLYLSPKLAMQQAWSQLTGSLVLSVFFAATAGYCLIEASRPYWAAKLFERQVIPDL
jgi:hypothetical protein